MEHLPVVYVVDDDPSVREGMASLVRSLDLEPVTFESAAEFLAFKRGARPGCLVLDVMLPGLSGLDLQRELVVNGDELPIVFITGHGDIPMSVRAMKGGAVEFLAKPFTPEAITAAIHEALLRDKTLRDEAAKDFESRTRFAMLSAREREVATLVVKGLLNKQIAAQLGISEVTVKAHRRHIMDKLQLKSLPELVRLAGRMGMDGEP